MVLVLLMSFNWSISTSKFIPLLRTSSASQKKRGGNGSPCLTPRANKIAFLFTINEYWQFSWIQNSLLAYMYYPRISHLMKYFLTRMPSLHLPSLGLTYDTLNLKEKKIQHFCKEKKNSYKSFLHFAAEKNCKYKIREMLATYILTHFSTHSFWLVKIHMGPTKFIWDPHNLVGLMWILTNQRECVGKCVASIPHKIINNHLLPRQIVISKGI